MWVMLETERGVTLILVFVGVLVVDTQKKCTYRELVITEL